MRTSTIKTAVFLLFVITTGTLAAQEEEPEEPRTIEDLYLESNVGLAVIDAQLRSEDRTIQLLGLEVLRAQVERGAIDPDGERYVELLGSALANGVFRVANNRQRLPENYSPEVRILAARMLGESGTDEAVEVLYMSLQHDPEPSVRAQAMYSLGQIGKDPEQRVSYLIARTITIENAHQADEAMVYAAVTAIGMLSDALDGDSLHPDVHDAVVSVAAGNYNRVIRTRAIEVLSDL